MTIKAEISADEPDPTTTLMQIVKQYEEDIKDAIVRIQVSVPPKMEGSIRDAEIYKILNEAYYVVVSREIKKDTDYNISPFISEELGTIEALEKYFELKKISDERRQVLLEYGENLIKEAIGEKEERQGE